MACACIVFFIFYRISSLCIVAYLIVFLCTVDDDLPCVRRVSGSVKPGLFPLPQFKWSIQGGRHRRQQGIPRDHGTSSLRPSDFSVIFHTSDGVLEDKSLASRILEDWFYSPWPWPWPWPCAHRSTKFLIIHINMCILTPQRRKFVWIVWLVTWVPHKAILENIYLYFLSSM